MNELPFLEEANTAAGALLSCMRQDMDYTAKLCERMGVTSMPGHWDAVFQIMLSEWREGRKFDWVRVARKLKSTGAQNGSSPTSVRPAVFEHHPLHGAEHYARTLAEAQAAIQLHTLGRQLIAGTQSVNPDTAWLMEQSTRTVAELTKAREQNATGLSFRTPEELVGLSFDDTDIILENRVLAVGQSLVLAAAAGIGKSRMLLQLAACVVVGRPFLGMNVVSSGWPWLIFQTENTNRRLSFDLGKIKAWLGPGDFAKFSKRCQIHTLEKDDDSLLNIESGAAIEAMQKAIAKHPSQIVVFDPLNSFTSGNLNQDQDMRAVISTLSKLSREGMTDRIPLFLHHALTGAGGAAKATGFDRSSFARNSKTLLAWTRAQINVAPASADDNTRLVVACGKNSNGREFSPFGIVLDEDSMIYDVDPEFNVEQWQEELSGKGRGRQPDTSPEDVVNVLRDLKEASDSAWQKECKEELSIAQATFYRHKRKAVKDGLVYRSKMTKLWVPK